MIGLKAMTVKSLIESENNIEQSTQGTSSAQNHSRESIDRRILTYISSHNLLKQLLPEDVESKKKRTGLLHATIVTLSLLVLLLTILTAQEPHRYTQSYSALQKGVHFSDLQSDKNIDIDHIWDWIFDLADEIGGETVKDINYNCRYDDSRAQSVNVDGKDYDMVQPHKLVNACSHENLKFIGGEKDLLYLIGDHQILAFGIFTKRADAHFPIEKSVPSDEKNIEVYSDKAEPLNPLKDDKVIEVCTISISVSAPSVASTEYKCVSKDGFAVENAAYTPGATMNWTGKVIYNRQDGKEYRAYNSSGAKAYFFDDEANKFTSYVPCFILGADSDVESGILEFGGTAEQLANNFTKCRNAWVSRGREFRTQCIMEQSTGLQASAHQAYLAGVNNMETVPLTYEHFFGCESLLNRSFSDLGHVFVGAHRPVSSYLNYDQSYGIFFPTQSEKSWAEDVIIGETSLKMHGFLDRQTTTATTYIVTRNLDEDALFYSLVKVIFSFRVSGHTSIRYEAVFSPMIQYNYGLDGYARLNQTMFVWEISFLIIFSLFTLREIYQLVFLRVLPFLKKRFNEPVILPVKENENDEERPKSSGKENYEKSRVRSNSNDVQEIESFEENFEDQVKPTIDLNGDGKDDILQIRRYLKQKSIEADALVEKVKHDIEELMPDAAGMLDILDWLTICFAAITIYYRVDYVKRTGDLHELFLLLSESHDYDKHMTEIINDFEGIRVNVTILDFFVLCLIFSGIIQFFRYLSFDKRLGIVTATVKDSLEHLVPVLIIFVVVIFSYAILGTVIYGQELNEWSNVGKSISQLCLMLLGEIPAYYGIMEVNPLLSAIFFWSYTILALFLLFNMILAVIFLVYDKKGVNISVNNDDIIMEIKKER